MTTRWGGADASKLQMIGFDMGGTSTGGHCTLCCAGVAVLQSMLGSPEHSGSLSIFIASLQEAALCPRQCAETLRSWAALPCLVPQTYLVMPGATSTSLRAQLQG